MLNIKGLRTVICLRLVLRCLRMNQSNEKNHWLVLRHYHTWYSRVFTDCLFPMVYSLSRGVCKGEPPQTEWLADRCKNITFLQLHLRAVNNKTYYICWSKLRSNICKGKNLEFSRCLCISKNIEECKNYTCWLEFVYCLHPYTHPYMHPYMHPNTHL